MLIKKKNIHRFYENSDIGMLCPNCCEGKLRIKNISHKNEKYRENPYTYDDSYGQFEGFLECQNESCPEIFITGNFDNDKLWNVEAAEHDNVKYYYDVVYKPNLHLFKINENIPEQIKQLILKLFELFRLDFQSAKTKLNEITEEILKLKEDLRHSFSSVFLPEDNIVAWSELYDEIEKLEWILDEIFPVKE